MKKRLLATLLAVIMIVGLLPVTALATGTPTVSLEADDSDYSINWNGDGDSVTFNVTLKDFTAKASDFASANTSADTRTKVVYVTWYQDAEKNASADKPNYLELTPTSTYVTMRTQIRPSANTMMTAGTYYFTLTAHDKDNNEKAESPVMTLVVAKTDHDLLTEKHIEIQNAAVRTGTITLADIFGTETVPVGAAFKADTISGTTNLISSLTLNADGALEYSSVAGATIGDTYSVTITSTNYNDMTATIVFEPTTQIFAPDAPVMQKPQNGNGQVTLNWDAPANDGGAEVSDFLIAYSETDTAPTDEAAWTSTGSTETTYTVTGLTNATAYYFWVKASNGTKISETSNSVTARPSQTYLTIENNRSENWDTSGDTLIISTAEDFAQFNWLLSNDDDADDAQVAGKTIELADNIDISHYVWVPCSIPENTIFDGCGHTITYYIDQLSYEYNIDVVPFKITGFAGLFLSTESGSTLCNLKVDGEVKLPHASATVVQNTIGVELVEYTLAANEILPSNPNYQSYLTYFKKQWLNVNYISTYLGGIVCDADGEAENPAVIDNCTSSVAVNIGTVDGSSAERVYYGGIAAATTYAELNNSKFDGSFTADSVSGSYYGCLIGQPAYTTISKCESAGSFNATAYRGTYIGGIAGAAVDLTIKNSLFSGTLAVSGSPTAMAGLVASSPLDMGLTIENSLVTGDIGTGYAFVKDSAGTTNITNTYAVNINMLTGTLPVDAMNDGKSVTKEEAQTEAFSDTLNAGQTPRVWSKMENGVPVLQSYVQLYTVTFDANGGQVTTASLKTNYEQKLNELPEPTKSGSYRFNGWYLEDGTLVTLDTVFTEDTTVTAKWTYNGGGYVPSITYFTLTFNTNGGTTLNSVSKVSGTTIDLSDYKPTREGYTFDGWYSDSKLTNKIISVKLTKSTTVYAGWRVLASIDNFKLTNAYNGFDDVDESLWYGTQNSGVIRDAVRLGIVDGYGNNKFGPEDELKISEAIKIACMIHSIYMGDGYDFAQSGTWYDVYVDYAIANGLIQAGDFADYTAVCTRSQAAYIFTKALPESELANISSLTPSDVTANSLYANEIFMLYRAGIFCGNDELGTFGGDGAFTRAQAAAIITRLAMADKRIVK